MSVCIIGGGIIGCATSLELRRRDFEVTVIDRHGEVGHGSTSASCGIVRRFYSQPGMIAMAHESAAIWEDWASHLGPIEDDLAVFQRPGMVFIPPCIDDDVRAIVATMQKLGVRASLLNRDEVAERFPFFATASYFPTCSPDSPAFFEPSGRDIEGAVVEDDAGYVISPGLATQNLRRAAEREGARFMLRHCVSGIRKRDRGGFSIDLDNGSTIEAAVLVNAAGPHSSIINRMAGVKLPLETRPLRREVHAMSNPLFDEGIVVPILGDLDGGIYCRPEAGGRDLIVGSADPDCDALDWVEDPDNYQEGLTEAYWQRQCLRLMKRLPKLRLGPARGLSALYDVTVEDWYPIADRTDMPGYYVCIGTSGSSFKTSPVLGRMMATIVEACEGGRDIDRDPIRLELPRIGTSIDTGFLSRHRRDLQSTGTVIG